MADKSPMFTPPMSGGPMDNAANIIKVPMDKNDFGFRKSQQKGLAPKNGDMNIAHVKNGG